MNIYTEIGVEFDISYDETLINLLNLFIRYPYKIIDNVSMKEICRGYIEKEVKIRDDILKLDNNESIYTGIVTSIVVTNGGVTIYVKKT